MKIKKFLLAFKYAFAGIFVCIKKERNLKIHFLAAILVTSAGFYFQISKFEWLVLILIMLLVIVLEILNSALEAVVDLASPKIHPKAKFAKDAMAGAVLVAAIGSVIVGVIVFGERVLLFV